MTQESNHSRPSGNWTVFLVHHTHVDIGYTEPQRVILRKHADFVAQALDFCTASDTLPPGERFCWTCEVAWTVKAFLQQYPHRREEFFRRVREGRIEVTALYLQLTDLFTLELLEETTDYACQLAKQHGFELLTAMNDDVNGWAWGLPDLLRRRGVRYMDTAINETRALGVRPRPRPYRWTGPEGGTLLLWHGDGYLQGNALRLGQPAAEESIERYLSHLEASGYPTTSIEVRVHGRCHDNAPPGLWLCDAVQAWNKTYQQIHLVLCTPRQWFEHIEANWGDPIQEHRLAWCDWWADGNGSALYEVAAVRQAQADLKTIGSLAGFTGAAPQAERLQHAREAATFFCEHTWGAWCSTDDPASLSSKAQWNTKAEFGYAAAVEAQSLLRDMLWTEVIKAADDGPGLLVFNPLPDARTDAVELLVADADMGLPAPPWVPTPRREDPPSPFHLQDVQTGQRISVERRPAIDTSARKAAQIVRFIVNNLPPGLRRYRALPGEHKTATRCRLRSLEIQGPRLTVVMSADGAGITSVRDARAGLEQVRPGTGFALGEVIYETIPGPFGREKLCGWGELKRDCAFARTPLRFESPKWVETPYGARVRLLGRNLPGSLIRLSLEIIVYDDLPRMDLHYELDKAPTTEAEALYCALPLGSGERPEVWLNVPGGWMRPGLDQIAGSASDWHSLQHGLAVVGGGRCVAVASPDVPLVQVNGINTGRWQPQLPPHNGLVMSWVLNNYWFTNFPASQGGTLRWKYSLMAWPSGLDRRTVGKFLAEIRQPMAAALIPTTLPPQ